MKKGTRDAVITVAAAVAVVAVVFSGLYAYSGIWPPFSVIESGSMQHSDRSTFDTIDTGDVVVVRSPDKVSIRTYVDGYKEGYMKFGDYGDVIVYERTGLNPVIHRAVIWLDWNPGKGIWEAPSLEGFPEDKWSNGGGHEYMNMSGVLTFHDYGFSSQTIHLNLDLLPKVSGYATKGDNPVTNPSFDVDGVPGVKGLIPEDRVLYVAGFSIPWLGVIKLYLSGDQKAISAIPANSVPEMIAMAVAVISVFAALFVIGDYISWYRRKDDQ